MPSQLDVDKIRHTNGTDALTFDTSGNTNLKSAIIEGSSSGDLVRITQTGSGNALVVEDSANPDSSPFVVNANGNVLSGNTTSATYPDYYGSARPASVQVTTDNSDNGSSVSLTSFRSNSIGQTYLSFNKANGTKATPTALVSNSIIGSQLFNGYDGTAFIPAANIIAAVDGTPGTNDMPGRLVFSTTADGASSPTERMRIHSNGNTSVYGDLIVGTSSNWTFQSSWVGIKVSDRHSIQATPSASSIALSSNASIGVNGWEYTVSGVGAGKASVTGSIFVWESASTGTDGDPVTWSERMRIDSSGNVGLTGGGTLSFYSESSVVGSIVPSSIGTTYNTTSDFRLKDNIQPISDGTEKLMAMNPVSHTWKADPEAPSVHGFIAQEMVNIIPEAVSGTPDGEEMMTMDYGRITPVLVAALQDAHKKIKELENRLNTLESN